MRRYWLELVVFVAGAVVMVLELTGSRVLAPTLGTSIFVWTSLIGIILGSLGLGYWLGGRLADHGASARTLSIILLLSGFCIALTASIKTPILEAVEGHITGIRLAAVVATVALFSPASVLLGMISPYAVALKMENLERAGRTVGSLYAISAVGSIAGTFAAGFYLLSSLGHTRVLALLAVIMALCAVIAHLSRVTLPGAGATLVLAATLAFANHGRPANGDQGELHIEVDTRYSTVVVAEHRVGDRTLRTMSIGGNPSAVMDPESREPYFAYNRFYRLAEHFHPDITRALAIGGGAYSFPLDFLTRHPDATLDVVEIDPGVTDLARRYFGLTDHPGLTILHQDGRTFLNRCEGQYDAIYMDAFRSLFAIPHQLVTVEAFERARGCLAPDGVLLINVASAIEGEQGVLLRAIHGTISEVFPHVLVYPAQRPWDGLAVQNIIVVGLVSDGEFESDSSDPEMQQYLDHRWAGEVGRDVPVLTDDLAPVERYVAGML